jgi:hypothetical protein
VKRAAVLSLAAALQGCTLSGVLELEIVLPVATPPTAPVFVQVQARKDVDFMADWLGTGDLEPIELSPTSTTTDRVSIVSDDELTDLRIKLSFCEVASCADLDAEVWGQAWYELQRPFYLGKQTRFTIEVPAVPTGNPGAPVMVDRCDIEGCVEGELSSFCRADGRHLCE